jgi:hypothetical protein
VKDERVAPGGHVPVPDDGPSDAIWRDGGLRAALRALRPLVGGRAIDAASSAPPLERFALISDPPAVASCTVLETGGGRLMSTAAAPGVSAFLDGIQRSRVIGHIHGSPIVFATVAAVVRERVDRRMTTWSEPRLRHLVLASRSRLGEANWAELSASSLTLIDLTGNDSAEPLLHPLSVRARALEVIAQEREAVERRLAAEWCEAETRWLWIDGGVSGNLAIDDTSTAFGVVKSHNTLYGDAAALDTMMSLEVGERGPLFLVQHRSRRAVASWYLRVHASDDGDPLHGLVRVEVAPPSSMFASGDPEQAPDARSVHALAQRADEISAWILAERAPIALPDPRWDTLTYGVYACEQFLKAFIGA